MEFATIVVGMDDSPEGSRALDAAIDIASGTEASVHVVSAFDPPTDTDLGRFLATLSTEHRANFDPTTRAQEVLRKACARLRDAGVTHQDHLVDDDPATAILEMADKVDADLIIVASRGRGRSSRFLRGSVSTRVALHADRNLLVMHDGEVPR